MINFVKATLVSGEPILVNEQKIESFYVVNEECIIVFESGNEVRVKKSFFDNIIGGKK